MAINYTFVARLASIYGRTNKRRLYATAQSTKTVTTRDIAHHLASHNSPFSVGTIIGLLQDAQKCIMEQLMDGARVDLDDLGAFYTTIASRGADTSEEFDNSYIKSVNLRWRPSTHMKQAINRTPLNYVPKREEMRKAKRKHKEDLDKELAASKQKESQETVING